MSTPSSHPRAVAEIPDGQRRWAKKSGKSYKEAYEIGAENIRRHIAIASQEGVQLFALWGGSVENLRERPAAELLVLHQVYEKFLTEIRDRWMDEPENASHRFVHMGRVDLLSEKERTLIEEIAAHTKHRSGMTVAVCLGYSSWDEEERAETAWREVGSQGSWKDFLDLPRQGVPFQTFDLIIRTGEGAEGIVHDNEFLRAYRHETRLRFRPEFFPEYSPEAFQDDIAAFRRTTQRHGA